jgi:2,3-bisphosphoglycerate-dependent phosphoglycerate mutase
VPLLKAGKTVLVAAHGNSLRSIVMAIEELTPEQILKRELATGEPVVYRIGADGKLAEKVAV